MDLLTATLVLLAYGLLCYWCWRRYRQARGRKLTSADIGDDTWLVGYASQTGTAEDLARKTVNQLQQAGMDAVLLPLNKIHKQVIQNCRYALFITSTFGEGEAPDNGNRFLRNISRLDCSHLDYGLLALGDRNYRNFCGFGHQVQQTLQSCGARPLFDMIEVDREDPGALRRWQYHLGEISGAHLFDDWDNQPDYQNWRLIRRRQLNVGSPGGPVFLLRLMPARGRIKADHWRAGDIAEIGPGNSDERIAEFLQALGRSNDRSVSAALRYRNLPTDAASLAMLRGLDNNALAARLPELPHREYSIASTPAQGTLDLLVRQVTSADGLGLGSGWLTQHCRDYGEIRLRIRDNHNFRSPSLRTPMILIGNGTGIAGLRSHLLARSTEPGCRNWLLFGERTAAYDFFFKDDIRRWARSGVLERLDLAFSRDSDSAARYVQDLLPPAADEIRKWVSAGAAIYVCGSLRGMAGGVHKALAAILGSHTLDAMAEEGRYRRDVY